MLTYKDVLNVIEKSSKRVYVAVFYHGGTYEWLPIDKQEYIRQLKMIANPEVCPFPCWFEIESDGEMFIHPKVETA